MIETYHLIFQISLGVSIALLVILLIYCIVFRVGYAISWLTGRAKKKEMRDYNPNAVAKVSKKPKKVKKSLDSTPYSDVKRSESAYIQSEGIPTNSEHRATVQKGPLKTSAIGTDIFEEPPKIKPGTDIFDEPQKQSLETDIFSEESTCKSNSPGTDIFEEDDEEDIFLSVGNVINDTKTDFIGTDILDDTAM